MEWWGRLGLASRVGVVGGSVIAFVMLILLAMQPADGLELGGVRVARQQPDEATATATSTPEDEATPTPTPGIPVIDNLQQLIAEYGAPPDATAGYLRIPKLGVDSAMTARYVDGDHMPLPSGPSDVTWYDMSAWDGMGGEPGQGGNAIFGGHVDYNDIVYYAGDVHYRGQAVLSGLRLLSPGDLIEVEYAGGVYTYSVTWIRDLQASSTDWSDIWSSEVPVDSITLFTCGGEFDWDTASYASRTVVRAERLPG